MAIMKATVSNKAGIILIPQSDSNIFFDVLSGKKLDSYKGEFLYSTIPDWTSINAKDVETLIDEANSAYWTERCVSLIQEVLRGIGNDNLEDEILEHIEEIIDKNKTTQYEILDNLLIAPLKDSIDIKEYIDKALSKGLSQIGSILDSLQEFQPLVERITYIWLLLGNSKFEDLSISKEELWKIVIEKLKFTELLQCKDKENFKKQWGNLAFEFQKPTDRVIVTDLGNIFANRIYPHQSYSTLNVRDLIEENYNTQLEAPPDISNEEAYDRVTKQIVAIIEAVNEGRDNNARKFLRELIDMQLDFPNGEQLVLKSLCQIAKKCADIYRYDFELYALKAALKLPSTDQWTYIQYGDHLKRAGKYNEALEVLDKPELENHPVAQALKADIYTEKGNYEKAIKLYEDIKELREESFIGSAIADVYRKMGKLGIAEKKYDEILKFAKRGNQNYLGETEQRAKAGIAEIAKLRGNLNKAIKLYEEILNKDTVKSTDRLVLTLGYCNVLKLTEDFEKAYTIIDKVIQEYPFAIEAKFIRGSILGLISKEREGLEDLSNNLSNNWKEWLRNYYKGLLLLKLERYQEAKNNLVDNIPESIDSDEEKYILRLGASIWFIVNEDYANAKKYLSHLPNIYNYQTKYLSLVLKLHLATKNKQKNRIKKIQNEINKSKIVDKGLKKAIEAINKNNFKKAVEFETDALLKLAA